MSIVTNSALKALVVEEDEYFALQLTTAIQAVGYQVIKTVANQSEALSAISTLLPDLVFMGLDSQEKKTFYNYAQALKQRTPPIIFITNFNKNIAYSNKKKTFKVKRETIRKAIKQTLTSLNIQQRVGKNVFKYNTFLFFAKRSIFDKVKIADILYFKAIDDYALVYTKEKVLTIFLGLKALKGLLQEDLFVQVHRSYLVNAQQTITGDFENNNIYINKEHIIPLSRRLKKEVLNWFDSKGILIPSQF